MLVQTIKRTGVVWGLGLGLALGMAAGAAAQGVNPPIAPNLPPPGTENTASTTWNGAFELFAGGSMQFAKATYANTVALNTSNVAGGQIALRYHVTDWNAVEFRLAMAEPVQTYGPSVSVKSRALEYSFDYALTFPVDGPIRPYLLTGLGRISYTPTGSNNTQGATSQSKTTLIYGGGVDVKLSARFDVRVEYRGLIYRVPDFGLITIGKWNHMPEPAAGIVFHF